MKAMDARTQLLAEIRDRLQCAHFAARGVTLRKGDDRQAVADQLHAIRLLAEELAAVLSRETEAAGA